MSKSFKLVPPKSTIHNQYQKVEAGIIEAVNLAPAHNQIYRYQCTNMRLTFARMHITRDVDIDSTI